MFNLEEDMMTPDPQAEGVLDNVPESESSAITLDDLKAGKIHISEIPRTERQRLVQEERANLQDPDEIEAWDHFGWRKGPFFLGKNRDGSPKSEVSAKEFMDNVRNFSPIQNERLRHLATEKSALEKKFEKLEAENRRTQELLRLRTQRDLQKEELHLDAVMREAEELGEVKRFAAAHEQKAQLAKEKEMLNQFEQPQAHPQNPDLNPEVIAFRARNPWFDADKVMNRYARQVDQDLRASNPDLDPYQHLLMVEQEVKTAFPSKFSASATHTPAGVESARGAGNFPAKPSTGGLTFEQLPEDEKLIAQQMLKKGMSKAQFMADYNKSAYAKKLK